MRRDATPAISRSAIAESRPSGRAALGRAARGLAVLSVVLLALGALGSPPAHAAASPSQQQWRAAPVPPPPGGTLNVAVGYVSDISFWAPNRGLMLVAGNASVRPGLFAWNGERWRQLATVCGGGINGRIAWAGPREFWTITAPSVGNPTSGQGLCHFRDGAVVASYSFHNLPAFEQGLTINAAACRGPSDCWFGGVGGRNANGSRVGAFHLHWDGRQVSAVFHGQGRGVSDLVAHRGQLLESSYVGPRAGALGVAPFLRDPEPTPVLLRRIDGTSFVGDPFRPAALDGVPADGTELRGLDSDGATAWAVGGGAGSGPAASGQPVQRPPIAVRRQTDGPWRELPLTGDLPTDHWLGVVAALPGTGAAWASLTQIEGSGEGNATAGEPSEPLVVGIDADGGTTVVPLDPQRRTGDAARGGVTAIACPRADDCWAATARGHLYRTGTNAGLTVDADPAFQGTIALRPNDAAEQIVPDSPPADDSRQFAPPVELPDPAQTAPPAVCDVPALVSRVRVVPRRLTRAQRRARNPRVTLRVSFRLRRRARVGLTARRGKRVVARVRARTLRPGTRRLTLRVRRRSYPTRMAFQLKELTQASCAAEPDPGGTLTTRAVRP